MNYEALLRKYMQHAWDSDGATFPLVGVEELVSAFTQEEIDELVRLADEAGLR
jgi:hypothetical protein